MKASLKKKHQDATSEMAEQVDQLNKMRSKVEKEKHAKSLQIEEVRAAMDLVANERATLEKQNRLLEQQRLDVVRRADAQHRGAGEQQLRARQAEADPHRPAERGHQDGRQRGEGAPVPSRQVQEPRTRGRPYQGPAGGGGSFEERCPKTAVQVCRRLADVEAEVREGGARQG